MKIDDLLAIITNGDFEDGAEIFVEGEEGLLHDFDVTEKEPTFDGFDSYSPEGLKIVIKD